MSEQWEMLLASLEKAKKTFRSMLLEATKTGGLTEQRYCNYLSMQYHLTKDVQRHFFAAAGNSVLAHRKSLREFLVKFALEEESHFEIAQRDLKQLGRDVDALPIPVKMWWTFFDSIIFNRPFLRLGATCVLENISTGNNDIIDSMFAEAKYLTPKNTVFFRIHRHGEDIPHGQEILEALHSAKLEEAYLKDLVEGAEIGQYLYLNAVAQCLK